MTLPTGPITLLDLQNEYGGSNPISLSEYYRGGGRVNTSKTSTSNYRDRYVVGETYWFTDSDRNKSGYYLNGSAIATNYSYSTTSVYQQIGASKNYTQRGSYKGAFGQFRYYRLITFTESQVSINTTVPSSGVISLNDFKGQGN